MLKNKIPNLNLNRNYLWILMILYSVVCVPMQMATSFYFSFWVKTLFIFPILFIAIKIEKKQLPFKVLWLPIGSFVVFLNSRFISESIILGKPIAKAYYAESPGTIEFNMYVNNKCSIVYGGIGSTYNYGKYLIEYGKVIVKANASIYELNETQIKVGTQSLTLIQYQNK